jgi:galactose oxidase-like protein/Kelch motif protein
MKARAFKPLRTIWTGGALVAVFLICGVAGGGQRAQSSGLFATSPRPPLVIPPAKVLIAGGCCDNAGNAFASAELYSPAAGVFAATGTMKTAREQQTATLLLNGKVLIAGGNDGLGNPFSSAELYNPATGAFAPTGAMKTARTHHSATRLQGGRVLVAGGEDGSNPLASAQLYNPTTGQFVSTGSMKSARWVHTATLLQNGKILVAGGVNDINDVNPVASAELYDPATGKFAPTGSMTTVRAAHTATLLQNGKVLITGGQSCSSCLYALASAELYDPASGKFQSTGSMKVARQNHTAVLLQDGRVLVAGGNPFDLSESLASAEIYDPKTGKFTLTGGMNVARVAEAVLLQSGEVLIAGGANGDFSVASAELYNPKTGKFAKTGNMTVKREGQTAALLH